MMELLRLRDVHSRSPEGARDDGRMYVEHVRPGDWVEFTGLDESDSELKISGCVLYHHFGNVEVGTGTAAE